MKSCLESTPILAKKTTQQSSFFNFYKKLKKGILSLFDIPLISQKYLRYQVLWKKRIQSTVIFKLNALRVTTNTNILYILSQPVWMSKYIGHFLKPYSIFNKDFINSGFHSLQTNSSNDYDNT